MKNKSFTLFGLLVASISYFNEETNESNKELDVLVEELSKYSDIRNEQDLKNKLNKIFNYCDSSKLKEYTLGLEKEFEKYFAQESVKQLEFIYGDINSDTELKKVIELEASQNGIIDEPVIKVEIEEDLLVDFENEFLNFEETLNSFNIAEEVESLDNLLKELNDFSNNALDSQTKVDDEVIAQIAQEVENEKASSQLDRMVDDYLEEMIDKVTESQLEFQQNIINDISLTYPHLSKLFIEEYFALKETIAQEYQLNSDAIILHRLVFKDLFKLQAFVDVISNHEYYVNVDEIKLIVDCFKKIEITDGKILTEIFTVADIASSLDGHYEGYLVE